MTGFFTKVLRRFTMSSANNDTDRHIVNEGQLQRENSFVAVINCKRFRPDMMEYLKAAIRKLTNPRTEFTLINKGEIVMTEKLIIISKDEIPLFKEYEDEIKSMNSSAKTDKKFTFTNKGRLEVSTKVYFVVANYNDFMTTGVLRQLTEEGIGSIPITVARNTGRITKNVEIVHGLSEEEARAFEQNAIAADQSVRTPTESQAAMMRQFNVTLNDARCFDLTLSSIPGLPDTPDAVAQ